MTESVVAATDVEVPVDPDRAFRIFTEEIDDWWVRSPTTFMDGGRARGRRIEPGVGGRLLEVYDDAAGDVLELGRITVWEPGKRLVLETPDETEADFRFEATGSGTRVSVEHRLLPGRDPKMHVVGGMDAMVDFFAERACDPEHVSWAQRDLPRVSPVLWYADVQASGRWLLDVFGLQGRMPEPGRLPPDFPVPLTLCGATVIVRGFDAGDARPRPLADHEVYAYVDDLAGHYAHAVAGGASIVREPATYGDRTYVAEDVEGHRWTFAQARPTQR